MGKPVMTLATENLNHYRSQAIKAAKDLCYGEIVIKAVKKAKTEEDIRCIMQEARRKKFG